MVHLVTGYAGYAHIKSGDEGAFNASFFGGGQYVMDFGNCFMGSIIDNNTVRILDGDGLMFGRHFRIEPNSYEDMAIETGTSGTKRIDLICMVYEKNAGDETERCYLKVIKGAEASGTAVSPEYIEGNIIEGALYNEMPMYKVTIEGVVLSKVDQLFEILPSYKKLAKKYADEFSAICDEQRESIGVGLLKEADVVDNLVSTSTKLPLSANQGRVLDEKIRSFEETKGDIVGSPLGKALGMSTSDKWADVVADIEGVQNRGTVSKSITPSTTSQTYTIEKGYHSGSGKITVAKSQMKTKTVTVTSASTSTKIESTAGASLTMYALTIPLDFTHTVVGLWAQITDSDTDYYQCNTKGHWGRCNWDHFVSLSTQSSSTWKTDTSLTVYVSRANKEFSVTVYYI